jgi:hypothetical protein
MDATAEVNVLRTSAARFPRRDLLASKMALKVFSLLVGGTGALTDMGLWMEKNEATLISSTGVSCVEGTLGKFNNAAEDCLDFVASPAAPAPAFRP